MTSSLGSVPVIHPTAIVEEGAQIGDGTRLWHFVHVRSGARVGSGCNLGKNVYVDVGVCVGNNVKIQNNVSLYQGVEVADGVFLGPHVCFTNDLRPRAIHPDGSPRDATDWVVTPTRIGFGASIGANSTLRAGVQIGAWAMVGAGSVVTKDVPLFALVYGNPARLRGVVAPSGEVVSATYRAGNYTTKDGAFSFAVPVCALR